jgi:hypothetical protein
VLATKRQAEAADVQRWSVATVLAVAVAATVVFSTAAAVALLASVPELRTRALVLCAVLGSEVSCSQTLLHLRHGTCSQA